MHPLRGGRRTVRIPTTTTTTTTTTTRMHVHEEGSESQSQQPFFPLHFSSLGSASRAK